MAEIRLLEEVEHFPNMNTWAPIQRNILTEDDNHINIPYFGDQVDLFLKLVRIVYLISSIVLNLHSFSKVSATIFFNIPLY